MPRHCKLLPSTIARPNRSHKIFSELLSDYLNKENLQTNTILHFTIGGLNRQVETVHVLAFGFQGISSCSNLVLTLYCQVFFMGSLGQFYVLLILNAVVIHRKAIENKNYSLIQDL